MLNLLSPKIGDKTIALTPPRLCSRCRNIRRFSFRNVRHFYYRKSDLTSKQIIAAHHETKPFPVYDFSEWYGDNWDASEFSQDIDWNRSFLDQFREMYNKIPQWSKVLVNCENCDFSMNCADSKNCYLSSSISSSEDCYYSSRLINVKNAVDCLRLSESEQCYECIDSSNLYNCSYLQNCKNMSDSDYCFDCDSCSDCFLCTNLRQKKYCIFNQQYEKTEYEKIKSTFLAKGHEHLMQKLLEGKNLTPHRDLHNVNVENSSGDFLLNCKNVNESYFITSSTDSRHLYDGSLTSTSMDCSTPVEFERCYEVNNSYMCYEVYFCDNVMHSSNVFYSRGCDRIKNCFGCSGLKDAEYCIFNKQYTKEEYEELVPKIIEKMKTDGEWGEFFPISDSAFAYNEAEAFEFAPLLKEEVLAKGLEWYEEDFSEMHLGSSYSLPTVISEVDDDITTKVLTCDISGRPYKILSQELDFYRKMNISPPHKAPLQRHLERIKRRNPRKLWNRECDKCSKAIITSYAPDRPEIVYCEQCYLSEVY
jgi:hypothetical protein